MPKFLLPLLSLLYFSTVSGQNTFKAIVKDLDSKELLVGANAVIQGTAIGASANQNGLIEIRNVPAGQHIIVYSYIGYQNRADTLIFPLSQTRPFEIFLSPEAEETEAVFVSATRSTRTIADIPTRVETISGEELDEKANMKPGDIRMLLNESTGIQTQQTSATSFNSSIRIQGLDGKYTQILKDGYPLYSGFSGGLSLLQIVPLDLKQVEVLKGSSSTLYGGGAIAGLINLVSKTPEDERELRFMFNGTSALGLDASGFYSKKFNKIGTVIFLSYNTGKPYDPADIGLSAIPEFNRYTANLKLFYYFNRKTTLNVGLNTTIEDRTGGDMEYLEGKADSIHSYFENNKTTRFSTQVGLDGQINTQLKYSLKNTMSIYDRSVKIPDYTFSGTQVSSFNEATINYMGIQSEWIAGLNILSDQFTQDKFDTTQIVDYEHLTWGAFLQNSWNISKKLILETGLRFDYQDDYGSFLLPRTALLVKAYPYLTFRLGGGFGYKLPTIFTEDAERLQFRNVLPVNVDRTHAEESRGVNLDINYRTAFFKHYTFSLNSLLFYTRINDPIVLAPAGSGFYEFLQPQGFIDTKGLETNIKLTFDPFKLFIGHTLADVKEHYNGDATKYPLVARNRLNNVLIYEVEDELRIGLEAYYFSSQKLSAGKTGRDYWIFGLMTEKMWENFSIFLNFENFLDTRQTKFGAIYTGSISNPNFKDIYAPMDGFVINGGVKLNL